MKSKQPFQRSFGCTTTDYGWARGQKSGGCLPTESDLPWRTCRPGEHMNMAQVAAPIAECVAHETHAISDEMAGYR